MSGASARQPHFEAVHTVTDYWDGPVEGIADFCGRPHRFQCRYDAEAEEYSKVFELRPLDEETFRLALEDWSIWLRWEAAFRHGEASLDSHPALPADRGRHDELKATLDERLRGPAAGEVVRAFGHFRRRGAMPGRGVVWDLEVVWTRAMDEGA